MHKTLPVMPTQNVDRLPPIKPTSPPQVATKLHLLNRLCTLPKKWPSPMITHRLISLSPLQEIALLPVLKLVAPVKRKWKAPCSPWQVLETRPNALTEICILVEALVSTI